MFIKKEDYQKVNDEFYKFHHGTMVKLTAPNRKNEIYGFILRCEANANDKKLLVFSFISPVYYSKLVPAIFDGKQTVKPLFKTIKEVKFYGMKRILEKWKNVKEDNYLRYNEITDEEFLKSAKADLTALKGLYEVIRTNIKGLTEDKINETSKYILKEFRMIERYYKDINDVKVIFL